MTNPDSSAIPKVRELHTLTANHNEKHAREPATTIRAHPVPSYYRSGATKMAGGVCVRGERTEEGGRKADVELKAKNHRDVSKMNQSISKYEEL